jgi:hypothetical protein
MTNIELLERFIEELPVLDRWDNAELATYLSDIQTALRAIFREETDFEIKVREVREGLPTDKKEQVQERWDWTIDSVTSVLETAVVHLKFLDENETTYLPAGG